MPVMTEPMHQETIVSCTEISLLDNAQLPRGNLDTISHFIIRKRLKMRASAAHALPFAIQPLKLGRTASSA